MKTESWSLGLVWFETFCRIICLYKNRHAKMRNPHCTSILESSSSPSRNFQLMKISIIWIWWGVWSGVWKFDSLFSAINIANLLLAFKIWDVDMSIWTKKLKNSKQYIQVVKIYSYLNFPLLLLAPTFWTRNQKGGNFKIFPLFFNEICPKLCNLISFDEIEWVLEKKFTKSNFFHDLWIEFKMTRSGTHGRCM